MPQIGINKRIVVLFNFCTIALYYEYEMKLLSTGHTRSYTVFRLVISHMSLYDHLVNYDALFKHIGVFRLSTQAANSSNPVQNRMKSHRHCKQTTRRYRALHLHPSRPKRSMQVYSCLGY